MNYRICTVHHSSLQGQVRGSLLERRGTVPDLARGAGAQESQEEPTSPAAPPNHPRQNGGLKGDQRSPEGQRGSGQKTTSIDRRRGDPAARGGHGGARGHGHVQG